MRCLSSSLLAGAILMAVGLGAWWSWTTWTYNQSLEARLETIETRLAALEAGLEVNDRNKGVTSEPRPEGQNVLPKSLPMRLPRRLSTDKEVAVASEDFDSWKTYVTHGHGWWLNYLFKQVMQKSEEEGCEVFGAENAKFAKIVRTSEHPPECQDMSVIENVTKYAMDGNEERLFSVLEKHPDQPDLKDLALASAAFGLPVVRQEDSADLLGLVYTKEQWHLDSRIEIVRRLFTDGASGNSSFIDVGFKLAMKEKITVEPALLRLLTWGTLRRRLVRPSPSTIAGIGSKYGVILSLNWALDQAKFPFPKAFVPASVFQYAIDHPEFLDERSSEDRTLLMEASSLHSCKSGNNDPCLYPYMMVKAVHEELGVSFTAMDKEGKNAAMVAAQHGALDKAKSLQSAMLEEEMKKQPWIYHFKFMLSFVLVLHVALALVTLLFDYCSGGWEWWLVQDFLMKTGLLTACNVLIQYLVVPEVLLDPKAMLEVYINIHMPHSWPIFALLTAIFTVYTIYDLKDAVRLEREGAHLVPSVQAVNVYQDPKVSILTCMHTFLLSCIFVCVYWNKVVGPVQMNLFTRFCWAFALFVQYYLSSKFRSSPKASKGFEDFGRWAVCLDDQCGNNLWAVLLKKGKLEADGEPAPLLSRSEVLLRFFMDYIANGFFRILILYSLPVYLATSEQASDFALNAFAVTFISEIDNLSEPAEYQIEGYKSLESGKREIK